MDAGGLLMESLIMTIKVDHLKKIKEINLNGSVEYGGLKPVFSHIVTEVIVNNAIMLIRLSTVKKRKTHEIK